MNPPRKTRGASHFNAEHARSLVSMSRCFYVSSDLSLSMFVAKFQVPCLIYAT